MNANKLVSNLRLAIEANNEKIGQLEANRHSHSFPADATDLFAAWACVVPMTAEQKAENVEIDLAVDALIARNVRIFSIISEVEFRA